MSVPFFYEDYSGFFPWYIGDVSDQVANPTPGSHDIFIPFSLYSLCRLWWAAKSVTVTGSLAFNDNIPPDSDGEGAISDSGTLTGTFTNIVFPNTANTASTAPAVRANFHSIPQPLANGTLMGALNSIGTTTFPPPPTQAPINYNRTNELYLSFMPLTFESDDGINALVGIDDDGQYYLHASDWMNFFIVGGPVVDYLLAISPTSIVGPQGQAAIKTGATFQLSIGNETVSMPLYTSYNSTATITGSLSVAFDTFFTSPTG